MIQVTLTFASAAVAAAALQLLADNGFSPEAARTVIDTRPQGNALTATGKQTPELGAQNAAPKAKPEATSTIAATTQPPASDAQTASSEKPAGSPAKDEPSAAGIDYDKHVKPLVIKVGAAGKRDALVALLAKFGVAKGPEVPADKLPAFKSELEALVA